MLLLHTTVPRLVLYHTCCCRGGALQTFTCAQAIALTMGT